MNNFWCNSERWISQHYSSQLPKNFVANIGDRWTSVSRISKFEAAAKNDGQRVKEFSCVSTDGVGVSVHMKRTNQASAPAKPQTIFHDCVAGIDPSYREMFACARRENNDNLEDEKRIKLSSKSFHRRTRFHARLKKLQQWSESFGYTNLQMKYLNQRCDTKSGDESGQDWSLIRLVDSICPKRYKCTLIKILVHKSLNALKILVIFNHIYLPIFLCTWYHLVIVSYHFDDIYIRQALFRKGF